MNEPQRKYLIFISHSHVDSWVAGQIAEKIEINQIEDYIAQLRKKLSLKVN